MPRPRPEALVAHGTLVRALAEAELLHIPDALDDETQGEDDDARDVTPRAEGHKGIGGDSGRVEDGDGEGDDPDPDHLEDPEAEEGEELVALVVEAVVLAGLEDAEEEEAREAHAPEHDEDGGDDLAGMGGGAGEGEGDDGEDDEVGAACEVCSSVSASWRPVHGG